MGMYKYLKEAFEKHYSKKSPELKGRMILWRRENAVERVEQPTNLARARELGYKAKKEYIIARVRIKKGKRARRKPDQGRKPGKSRKHVEPGFSHQWMAEQKAGRKFINLDVLNSYFVGEDGVNKYFEVILHNFNSSRPKRPAEAKKTTEAKTSTETKPQTAPTKPSKA